MDKFKQYSTVVLRPRTYKALSTDTVTFDQEVEGTIVEIYGNHELFTVDVGSSPANWETILDVRPQDIVRVIRDQKD